MRKDNDRPDVYISVYMPIAGWKSVMYGVDEECGGMHTPLATGNFAYRSKSEAIEDAENWARSEELEFFDDCPDQTDDAPDKSVTEQLREILGPMPVVNL